MVMKKQRFGQRKSKWERFNQSPGQSDFIRLFQILLEEKMMLKESGDYSREEFNKFIMRMGRPPQCVKVDTQSPIHLSAKISPQFYLDVQRTTQRMFGEYMAMDDLIKTLLIYFVENYGRDEFPKALALFRRVYPGRSKEPQRRFQRRFSPFFKNHVPDFTDA
jgi:hypothetical protein